MSEQIQDQISAFTDDELTAQECAFLVRRLERDPKSRDRVLRYSIIGAAMRGELPNPAPDALLGRVRAELDGVDSVESAPETPPGRTRLFRPAIGFGIAAGVAVAALALLNVMNNSAGISDPVPQVAGTQTGLGPEGDPSYIVPSEAAGPLTVGNALSPPPIRLTNYLITHGQYAPGIRRTSIHTHVISNEGTSVLVTPLPVQEP